MTDAPLTAEQLEALRRLDTPTVCNAIELLRPERRGLGFTSAPVVCAFPRLPPMVGYARTATIRSRAPSPLSGPELRVGRLAYYRYVGERAEPKVSVIQDLDGEQAGYGAFWGEVNTSLHKALGCLGVVTDGSIRDLDAIAPGFQLLARKVVPSHAFVHLVEHGGAVEVFGMAVRSGDLLHADRHGAVVIPPDIAARVAEAAALIARRERVILDACGRPGFSVAMLEAAMAEADEIH